MPLLKIMMIQVVNNFEEKTLIELDVRNIFDVNIVNVTKTENFIFQVVQIY